MPLSWLYFQNLQRINQILKLIAIVHRYHDHLHASSGASEAHNINVVPQQFPQVQWRRFASSAAAAAVVAPSALVDTISKPTPRGYFHSLSELASHLRSK